MPARRSVLLGALALPLAQSLAGCATTAQPAAPRPSSSPSAPPPRPIDTAPLAALERKYDCRLGVYAARGATTLAYRADERFAFCSTFKGLVAAALLAAHPLSYLDKMVRVPVTGSISPVTQHHVGAAMSIRQLCDAAVRYSDGTAANLLVRELGGPGALTSYLRGLGDSVSRLDQYEPELNRNKPDDPRDTTTPRALGTDYHRLVVEDALPADKRAVLVDWLKRNTTGGKRIRAGVPKGWVVADKTGTGDYGRAGDVGIAWPPGADPVTIAVLSDRDGYDTQPDEAVIKEAAAYAVTVL